MVGDLSTETEFNKLETKAPYDFLGPKLDILLYLDSHIPLLNISVNTRGISLCLHDYHKVPTVPYDVQDHIQLILA